MAVNRSGSIRIRGISELRKELKKLDDPKQFEDRLKDAHHKIALLVESGARPKLASLKGGMGSRAADTLTARRTVIGARIALGAAGTPWAQGIEFGAKRNLRRVVGDKTIRGWNQFLPWRGIGEGAGYAIFPTIRQNQTQIREMYEAEVGRITADAFPD